MNTYLLPKNEHIKKPEYHSGFFICLHLPAMTIYVIGGKFYRCQPAVCPDKLRLDNTCDSWLFARTKYGFTASATADELLLLGVIYNILYLFVSKLFRFFTFWYSVIVFLTFYIRSIPAVEDLYGRIFRESFDRFF